MIHTIDYSILNIWHKFAEITNNFFTPFFKGITFITEKGIIFIILSIILMLFKKTRKVGICMFGAVGLGAIVTNFILKDSIGRIRPYLSSDVYKSWWTFVGSNIEDGFSFPSGHTTAVSAAMMTLFIFGNKKYSWLSFLGVLLVASSRNYLMAHYPTDVLAAFVVGVFSSIVAYFITKLIYFIFDKYDNKIFNLIKEFNI